MPASARAIRPTSRRRPPPDAHALTGPGHVVLQSMPILNLAEEIAHYLPTHTEGSTASSAGGAVAAGAIGGILGGLLGAGSDKSS